MALAWDFPRLVVQHASSRVSSLGWKEEVPEEHSKSISWSNKGFRLNRRCIRVAPHGCLDIWFDQRVWEQRLPWTKLRARQPQSHHRVIGTFSTALGASWRWLWLKFGTEEWTTPITSPSLNDKSHPPASDHLKEILQPKATIVSQ